jgi:hypothetical protein
MKTVLKIVLGLGAVLYLVHMFGNSDNSVSSTDVRTGLISGKPAEVVRVAADDLFGQYDNNEVATDIALKGKIVEVTGRVASINKDVFDHMYVSLATRNQFMSANMHVVSTDEAKLAALRKGQFAVFRCATMKRWVGSPSGDDCVLMSAQ